MSTKKNIVVLARQAPEEAMRVAAGLTIFGHQVQLVFMDRPVSEAVANSGHAELLELSGIEPQTSVAAMASQLPYLDVAAIGDIIRNCDEVICL